MKTIDRYAWAVTERLPEDTREDVARELRTNIEDMLPDNATEEDVCAVLEKLGNPAVLANEYRQGKRYLIGPALYDPYISVLKLVIGIAAIAFTFLALIGAISESGNHLTGMIVDILSAAFEGAIMAFLWVTLIFALLERIGVQEGNLPFKKKKWSVDDLPQVIPPPESKISRVEVVVDLILDVIFISIFWFRPELFGWYESGDNGLRLVALVFDIVRLQTYIPAMVILAIIQFGMSVYKFIARRWTLPLAVVNTLGNLGIALLACLMLNDRSLFSQDLLSYIAGVFSTSIGRLETYFGRGIPAFLVVFVIICGIDSINGFVKYRKLRPVNIPEKK
jgi:hypothetical protein